MDEKAKKRLQEIEEHTGKPFEEPKKKEEEKAKGKKG